MGSAGPGLPLQVVFPPAGKRRGSALQRPEECALRHPADRAATGTVPGFSCVRRRGPRVKAQHDPSVSIRRSASTQAAPATGTRPAAYPVFQHQGPTQALDGLPDRRADADLLPGSSPTDGAVSNRGVPPHGSCIASQDPQGEDQKAQVSGTQLRHRPLFGENHLQAGKGPGGNRSGPCPLPRSPSNQLEPTRGLCDLIRGGRGDRNKTGQSQRVWTGGDRRFAGRPNAPVRREGHLVERHPLCGASHPIVPHAAGPPPWPAVTPPRSLGDLRFGVFLRRYGVLPGQLFSGRVQHVRHVQLGVFGRFGSGGTRRHRHRPLCDRRAG